MCGIVGYIGNKPSTELLLSGLEKLEYRGYDSAGIALLDERGLHIMKEQGRIAALRESVDYEVVARTGIGHTRWATHGGPSRKNAHPHLSATGRFALVHNGVIENYKLLSDELGEVELRSETDSEVVVQLLEQTVLSGVSVEEAILSVLGKLKGSYAMAILDRDDPSTLYACKNKSPLLIGVGEGAYVIASDAMAMLTQTHRFIEMMDEEMAMVKADRVTIQSLRGERIQGREPFVAQLDASQIDKGPYKHYMLKEIDEQPVVLRKLIRKYQDEAGQLSLDPSIRKAVSEADRVYMIGCGTSYHAGLIGKGLMEQVAGIPVEVHVASEFLYNPPLLSARPLFVFISQSGETADSRGVLVQVKKRGYKALTITNVPGSTLSREADYTLLTHAGPEIAVASTKAYTAQIAVLALLACDAAEAKGMSGQVQPFQELSLVAHAMEILINRKERMEELVWTYLSMSSSCFFLGRGLDYYVGLEGALKLKEISYIHAEGFAGGELKHGTLALIEPGTAVIALSTQSHVNANIRSNVQEVMARGANVCMISMEGLEEEQDDFILPRVHESLAPLIAVIPLQLMAYYAAYFRGCDIDKPRNLAKSVTVE